MLYSLKPWLMVLFVAGYKVTKNNSQTPSCTAAENEKQLSINQHSLYHLCYTQCLFICFYCNWRYLKSDAF